LLNEKKLPEKKDLKNYQGEDKVLSSYEVKLSYAGQPEQPKLYSRIPSLDKYTEGFEPGELISISGPTKSGKTLLAQTLTVNFSKQQEFPLWFTFEVPPRQFLNQFPDLPLFYLPSKLKAHVMPWVEDRILESWAKYHSRTVFIDHLHFLFDIAQARNTSLQIGSVIRALKRIAVDNGFIIFLMCHTHKNKGDDSITYENIRDSSFVAQESDSVFMIRRDQSISDNAAQLSVEFHRRTGVLEKRIFLQKAGGLLHEIEIEREV
jgi:predicted ATP-dependent serine protease